LIQSLQFFSKNDKKITSVGSDPTLRKFALDPVVVIFFEMKKFSFQKKLQV
jgi:hypothetical protein